jgi:hypothetical protein
MAMAMAHAPPWFPSSCDDGAQKRFFFVVVFFFSGRRAGRCSEKKPLALPAAQFHFSSLSPRELKKKKENKRQLLPA